jgi:UDP-N-acetylglucosamine--N-acetylmuramyl-(pentapeptide) pyrophosphoryl-undecaprenol N-acetylglucosamine transferase
MKVLFTGGGTLGPVTPLLAVAETWKQIDPKVEFVWVGTRRGPERESVTEAGIRFLHLPVARLTRYPSVEWLLLPFAFIGAFVTACVTLFHEKPTVIASAGGFTSVPLILAGKLFGIPAWIHQQDAHLLLSNMLVAPFARCITVSWKSSERLYASKKTTWIGNPVRPSVLAGKKDKAHDLFGLNLELPTVLAFGGGGGARWINEMMSEIGPWLEKKANVIHITGKGKLTDRLNGFGSRYHAVEFLTEDMAHALAAADVIVSRAGMGTLTEIAALKKAAVLIPIPGSMAQQKNAEHFKDAEAATVLVQRTVSVGDLKKAIGDLLEDDALRKTYGTRAYALLPTDVSESLIRHVVQNCK